MKKITKQYIYIFQLLSIAMINIHLFALLLSLNRYSPLYEPAGLQLISIFFITIPALLVIAALHSTLPEHEVKSWCKIPNMLSMSALLALIPICMHEFLTFALDINTHLQFMLEQTVINIEMILLVFVTIKIVTQIKYVIISNQAN